MLRARVHEFTRDELGAGTIMGLLWFMLLVGITGLAVDTTNGLRNRTMLQATADAAALAGAIDLPNPDAARANAVASSIGNMPDAMYGEVLQFGDVEIGAWDMPSRGFADGGVAPDPLDPDGALLPDSVRVILHQTVANANAVDVSFLRIVGLESWDVNVEAVAQRFIPGCLRDGLVARGLIDIKSNNEFSEQICIHGQKGVNLRQLNEFDPGVTVSMPDVGGQLIVPAGDIESNDGLPEALREQSLDPRMVNHINEIIDDILALKPYVMPDYIDLDGGDSGGGGCVGFGCGSTSTSTSTPLTVDLRDERWDFADAEAGHVYHIECIANKTVGIPSNITLSQMVIVADCQIIAGADVVLSDVLLASRAGGNPGQGGDNGGIVSGAGGAGISDANISFPAGAILGLDDKCATGGGVQIFTDASVSFSAKTTFDGVQIVAAGDVDLGAMEQGINGINVQAGGNITLASNNMFGLCATGAPNLQTVSYYRLVR